MKYKKAQKAPIPMIVEQMKRGGGKVQGSLNLPLRVRPSPYQAKRRRRNQINGTRVFRKKRQSDSLFQGERRLISLQYSGMLSISLRFHCPSPDMFGTEFGHAKPPRNIHAAREVTLSRFLKTTRDELPMEQWVYGGCLLCPSYPPLHKSYDTRFRLPHRLPITRTNSMKRVLLQCS